MHIPQATCEKIKIYQHELQVCIIDIKVTQEASLPIFPLLNPHSLIPFPKTDSLWLPSPKGCMSKHYFFCKGAMEHTKISVINQILVFCYYISLFQEDIKHETCGANKDVFHTKYRNIGNASQVINASSHKGRQFIPALHSCTGTVHCNILAKAAPA